MNEYYEMHTQTHTYIYVYIFSVVVTIDYKNIIKISAKARLLTLVNIEIHIYWQALLET